MYDRLSLPAIVCSTWRRETVSVSLGARRSAGGREATTGCSCSRPRDPGGHIRFCQACISMRSQMNRKRAEPMDVAWCSPTTEVARGASASSTNTGSSTARARSRGRPARRRRHHAEIVNVAVGRPSFANRTARGAAPLHDRFWLLYADERTRTSTRFPGHGPEPCASTNSATSAWGGEDIADASRKLRARRRPVGTDGALTTDVPRVLC